MKTRQLIVPLVLMLLVLTAGCAKLSPMSPFTPLDLNAKYATGDYVPRVDNFIIILDSSSSMGLPYKGTLNTGHPKFDVAKDLVGRINGTLPDMPIKGAIQTFGHGSCLPKSKTETIYGIDNYSRKGLEKGLDGIPCAGGTSPGGLAVKASGDLIDSVRGRTAVIFISDGEDLDYDPLLETAALKQRFGSDLCFYPVWVGNKPQGGKFMEMLAKKVDCGFLTKADDLSGSKQMADFVEAVFLAPVGDSDGDGVKDNRDDCPNTPPRVEVDERGCPKAAPMPPTKRTPTDRDGDGVVDGKDKCPDTPMGAAVDARGCWIVKGVKFDYDKSNIKPMYNSNLDNIVTILKKNPGLMIRIEGHTDNKGSMNYNMRLSLERAKSVRDYLVKKGIEKKRLSVSGFGFSRPVKPNDTAEGRAFNRRAELHPVKNNL
jgi:OOP family OmpA-OmpF porin